MSSPSGTRAEKAGGGCELEAGVGECKASIDTRESELQRRAKHLDVGMGKSRKMLSEVIQKAKAKQQDAKGNLSVGGGSEEGARRSDGHGGSCCKRSF